MEIPIASMHADAIISENESTTPVTIPAVGLETQKV